MVEPSVAIIWWQLLHGHHCIGRSYPHQFQLQQLQLQLMNGLSHCLQDPKYQLLQLLLLQQMHKYFELELLYLLLSTGEQLRELLESLMQLKMQRVMLRLCQLLELNQLLY